MNSFAEKTVSFASLRAGARNFPRWAVLCLVVCILLEIYFIMLPPRGYIAEDVILVGSIRGQPLISVQNLWEDVFYDDELMLEVLQKSAIESFDNKADALDFLNENIRKQLRFSPLNEILFKISFIQPGRTSLRPFLNTFSDRFLEEIKVLSDDELNRRRQRVKFQFDQLSRRNQLVYRLLAPVTLLEDLTPGEHGFSGELKIDGKEKWFGRFAGLLINELNSSLFAARSHFQTHTDMSQKILAMFPFDSMRLTNPETPPRPVQPYLFLFYLLIPASFFLLYLAGLILLLPDENSLSRQE